MEQDSQNSPSQHSEIIKQPLIQQQTTQQCKYCKNSIPINVFFCPICGKKLKEPPPSTDIMKQLSVYSVSIFLPPLGLIPAFKYLLAKERKAKIIGFIALGLTIASTVITIIYSVKIYNQVTSQINSFTNLQNIGY